MSRLVIFDLDGTLVDSNRDLVPALNRTIASEGLAPLALGDVGHVVGKGALEMLRRAYRFQGRDVDETRVRALLPVFIEHYEAHIADETVFFPGALAALDTLAARGWRLAVCTNKFEHLARRLLDALGETHRFHAVTGGDTFSVRKPDPGHLIETALLAGVEPTRCVMVGDTDNDILAAQAAPMPVIGATFGYTETPVSHFSPTALFDHFDELPQIIAQVWDAGRGKVVGDTGIEPVTPSV